MRKSFSKIGQVLLLGLLVAVFSGRRVLADEVVSPVGLGITQESVMLVSEEPIESAYGLLVFDPQDESQTKRPEMIRRSAVVKKAGEGLWQVVVEILEKDYTRSSKLSVIGRTKQGKIISSRIRPLGASGEFIRAQSATCRSSRSVDRMQLLSALSREELLKIVVIRNKRRDILRQLSQKTLEPELLAQIEKIERELGIISEVPLSTELSLEALSRRLGAIEALQAARDN